MPRPGVSESSKLRSDLLYDPPKVVKAGSQVSDQPAARRDQGPAPRRVGEALAGRYTQIRQSRQRGSVNVVEARPCWTVASAYSEYRPQSRPSVHYAKAKPGCSIRRHTAGRPGPRLLSESVRRSCRLGSPAIDAARPRRSPARPRPSPQCVRHGAARHAGHLFGLADELAAVTAVDEQSVRMRLLKEAHAHLHARDVRGGRQHRRSGAMSVV
jgi:hypothetical protein